MTKESILKKILGVFIILSVICLLWAIGANSRKKVELVKSSDLHDKLQQLTKANTVITADLKKTKNAIGKIKKAMKQLNKMNKEEKKKSDAFDQQLTKERVKNKTLEKKISQLQKTNSTLGKELTKAKENSNSHQKQITILQTTIETYKKQVTSPAQQDSQNSTNKSKWQ